MKRRILVNILISFCLCFLLGSEHTVMSQESSLSPPVVEAAIPVFPVVALATHQQGQVLVRVRIRNDGTVKSVEFCSGPSIFRPLLKMVASRWKFAPTNKTSEERSAILSFIFRLVPTDTE
ncbi:MAG: hypothetical protein C4325_11965, partial [Blastocatellia bacterium]